MPARTSKKTPGKHTHDDQVSAYIRDTCRELETRYDRRALSLLLNGGALCVDDPTPLDDAIAELADVDETALGEKICAAQERATSHASAEVRREAVCELEQLDTERQEAVKEAAYLLGIAVGRRLGAGALRPIGGAR